MTTWTENDNKIDPPMTFAKICGIKTLEQARAALDSGADFLGFVFYRPSIRYVEPDTAAEIVSACRAEFGGSERWRAVGVFVDEPLERANQIIATAGLDLLQACGSEERAYCLAVDRPVIRVVHVGGDHELPAKLDAADYAAARLMLDTQVPGHYGGTGQTYGWSAAREIAAECFLAGGLSPTNVAMAIDEARPWAVDVSSGVERGGVKDVQLIREFLQEVRRADDNLG